MVSLRKRFLPPSAIVPRQQIAFDFCVQSVRTAIFLFRIGVGGETCAVAEPTTGRSVESAREDKARARGETIADD